MNNDDRLSNCLNIDMCIEHLANNINNDFIKQQIYISILAYKREKEQEIERLNNIIDELERVILNTYPCMNMHEQEFKTELLNILNKSKELKGELNE